MVKNLLQSSPGGPPRMALHAEPEEMGKSGELCEVLLSRSDETGDALDALISLTARHPDALSGWTALGKVAQARGKILEAYAYFRVAYHHGLDRARAAGGRGDGPFPWEFPENRPFLLAVSGLMHCADEIGETGEAERCWKFLAILDPGHAFERKPG